MSLRSISLGSALVVMLGGAALYGAAAESRQQAETFAKKMAIISQNGALAPRSATPRRTSFTETEVNSWFTYRAQPLLPPGLTQPKVTIIGNGRVMGVATVDLEAVGKSRSSGGSLDLWSYLGRVPVTVSGVLHTKDGSGRFELQQADVSGVPVPKVLLQQLVSHYSRSTDHPEGVSLDDPFALPANIRQIEVGQGQAVVVQ